MRVLIALLFTVTGLAGCADGADGPVEPTQIDKDDFAFAAGTGAIAGLLVDDRFRPIDLTDDPETDFQAEGFVLLQETGDQVQTTENGEFNFLELEPGTYTLRVTASGHEAVPQKVQVNEGVFSEANLVARRIATAGERVEVTEFNFFIPCSAYATTDCTFDRSGDSSRNVFTMDMTQEAEQGLSYMHFDAKMNQPGMYCLEVRRGPGAGGAGDDDAKSFADWCIPPDHDYVQGILQVDANYMEDGKDPFDPTKPFDVLIFYFGNNEATCFTEVYHLYNPEAGQRCLGVALGVKAKVFATAFFDEPAVDLESYCLQC